MKTFKQLSKTFSITEFEALHSLQAQAIKPPSCGYFVWWEADTSINHLINICIIYTGMRINVFSVLLETQNLFSLHFFRFPFFQCQIFSLSLCSFGCILCFYFSLCFQTLQREPEFPLLCSNASLWLLLAEWVTVASLWLWFGGPPLSPAVTGGFLVRSRTISRAVTQEDK